MNTPTASNTHIAVVLDRSGSMESMRQEIIGGFNGFLEDQKRTPGTATMTLVQFDNDLDRLATFKPLTEVEPLTDKTYVPRGCTRLYDAIGLTVKTTIDEIGKSATKPDKVLVVILTDGLENASQEYNTAAIKALLETQQKDGWEFTFIGANQDAILTAAGIGLRNAASNFTFAATKQGSTDMLNSLSASVTAYRCAVDPHAKFAYAQSDRDKQNLDPASSTAFHAKATWSEHGSAAGAIGGVARAASLSSAERSKIASTAAKARWSNRSV